ncbi:hypothetical protein ACOMICROBIO_LKFPLAJE_01610 [Vibrio sp. B1FIG11]|uniref:hypothetical protein n=1 Tax=Vibrio sp. B1FIG11 TaxID=2751177 RepID=UPI0015F5FC1E|nr:hypothetical protein [Vibrio sp. B1FIG11]CAE6904069.1 hypothetical protein ACOMICROBIO_LKFPLAJE_01610 [Vibrio sp. B1FIG11]
MKYTPLIIALVTVSGLAYGQTSAFHDYTPNKPASRTTNQTTNNNQVVVSLPNNYDVSDILKVEINDYSYLSVHYLNKTTGREDDVWCARYTDSGLEKTDNAFKPVTRPLCEAGIAAFEKTTN